MSGGLSQLKNLFFYLYFSECKAELFIPFCNDTNYYSGNNVHVLNQNIFIFGNGQGYFNGKSRLIVDLFSNIDLYTGLVIRMRFIQDVNAGGTHVIFSFGDCCDNPAAMMMVSSKANLHFKAKQYDDR